MQFNYDDQIGGGAQMPQEIQGVGGGMGGGGMGGGVNVGGGVAAGGGMAGGVGVRIEGDTKDVSASQIPGGAHNQQYFGIPQHADPPPII